MKKIFALLFALFLLNLVCAINVGVEKQSSNEFLVVELNKPAIFDIKLTNFGESDNFEFYNLLGFDMSPSNKVSVSNGQTKSVQLEIFPVGEFTHLGTYTFHYFIRADDTSEIKHDLTFRVLEFADLFEIGSGEIHSDLNSIEIYILNKEDFNFDEVNAKFSSAFFNLEEKFSLEPHERKNFEVQLNQEDFKKLVAGFYTLNAEIEIENKKTNVEGVIKFKEQDNLVTTKKDYGFFINTQITEKVNEGNVLAKSDTVFQKNIVSRLFTSFSPEPDAVERDGLVVTYTWNQEIKPGESSEIVVRTNWLFPLIVIFFIVAIVILTKQFSKTNLILKKRVSFVKAKGGEFALKVSIIVNAKKYVERISVIDKLPPLVKIYERFGGEKPSRIDEKNKRIEWGFEKLEAGEIRMLSYIIYSKVGVLGKFALPSTTAIYERDGEIQEAESNKAFFVAEQRREKGGE